MEIINKGYINFSEQYNKKTDKFMSASTSGRRARYTGHGAGGGAAGSWVFEVVSRRRCAPPTFPR